MKETRFPDGKTGQEIPFDSAPLHEGRGSREQDKQDEIFRKMSADEKIMIWAQLWSFAKRIQEDRLNYDLGRLEKPTFEDLILSKLHWQGISPSSKQLEDVESIFQISGDKLNRKYLAKWVTKLGVQDMYKKIAAK